MPVLINQYFQFQPLAFYLIWIMLQVKNKYVNKEMYCHIIT